MNNYEFNTDAYLAMLKDVFFDYDYEASPRGMKIREKLNVQVTISRPDVSPMKTFDEDRNKIITSYTKREMDWYLTGNRKADSAPSKFWQTIADHDGNINSNYGHLALFDLSENNGWKSPYMWAHDNLVLDKDSRQAILRYNKPKHAVHGNKDFVCTMYQNFHIRNNQLHTTVRMRSADLFTGPVYDIPWFAYVQHKMLKDLRKVYKGLEVGSLTFSADSLHIYERDFGKVLPMITEPNKDNTGDTI